MVYPQKRYQTLRVFLPCTSLLDLVWKLFKDLFLNNADPTFQGSGCKSTTNFHTAKSKRNFFLKKMHSQRPKMRKMTGTDGKNRPRNPQITKKARRKPTPGAYN